MEPTFADTAASIDTRQFSALVRNRWTVSLSLTAVMLAVYYGFILTLAFRAELFAMPVGGHMTLGIPIGIGVIVASWLLTGIYVGWANTRHDQAVDNLKLAFAEERQ